MTQSKSNMAKNLIIGFQHVLAMFGATVLVPMLTGLDVSLSLLCAGLGTLLFHLVTKGKVPTFLGSSFAFISAVQIVAMRKAGLSVLPENLIANTAYQAALPYATGGIVVAGAVYLVMAAIVYFIGTEKFLKLFPPIVTGTMIIIIGLMLAPTAINSITQGGTVTGVPLLKNWFVAGIAIATIVCISLFTKGFFKLVPILFGIFVSYMFALMFGMVDFSLINNIKFLQVPKIMLPKFDLSSILIIAPISIVTFVEHIGDVTASSAVVGKNFMRDPGLHRTLIGDGAATMLAGFLGGPANTTYSENTSVLATTKNYNPATLRIAAVIAILLAFLGKFAGIIQTLPGAVIGGVSIVLYGMISAVGLRNLVENKVDFKQSRNLYIAAVMLVIGLGGATINFSETVSLSGVALSAILGIILNLILPNIEEQ
ncbi:MAG: uracil permease [Christensenellaceae bacterium]|nr:uracil permease [Christensenellaceae bacterium]